MKLAFLLLLAIALASIVDGHQYGVRLQDLNELTFRKDIWTKNVRDPPTTQLIYAGGNARRNATQVRLVKCVNTGDDWNCTANLDPVLNFTKLTINCEGATHSDDEYILPESCYLEYELNFMPIVQLGNITSPTKPVNLTNMTNLTNDTCPAFDNLTFWPFYELYNDSDTYPVFENLTFWSFDEFYDNPLMQSVMLWVLVVASVVFMFLCNCSCGKSDNDQKQVVDNEEDASESEESEELKM